MKNKVIKIVCLMLVYIAISVGLYCVLRACGLDSVNKIRKLLSHVGGWKYVIFFLFQVVVSTFICVVPFEDELLVATAIVMFGAFEGFFVASFNMFITSLIQFVIGRCFCKSLVEKFIGESSIQKYQNYLKVKGEIMLPVLYAIPLFPHDTLCFLAGMSKMKWWYFALVTLIMRSLEVFCVCFLGSGLIDFNSFEIKDWIFAINILIVDIYLMLKFQKYVENKTAQHKHKPKD